MLSKEYKRISDGLEDQSKRNSDWTAAAVRLAILLAELRSQAACIAHYCAPSDADEVPLLIAASCSAKSATDALRAALGAYVAFGADPVKNLEREIERALARPAPSAVGALSDSQDLIALEQALRDLRLYAPREVVAEVGVEVAYSKPFELSAPNVGDGGDGSGCSVTQPHAKPCCGTCDLFLVARSRFSPGGLCSKRAGCTKNPAAAPKRRSAPPGGPC